MTKLKSYVALRWFGLAVATFIVAVDQITKKMALTNLTAEPQAVIDGLFNLRLAFNRGVSFSMLGDIQLQNLPEILGLFAFVVAVIIIHYLGKHKERMAYILGLALILGGAIGNGIDRFAYGAVVDLLDFYYGHWHWPTFNVADIAISVGVVIMLYDAYVESNDTKEMEIDKGEEK